jgi:hypothetical protein
LKPAPRKEAQITLSSLRKSQFDLGLWGVELFGLTGRGRLGWCVGTSSWRRQRTRGKTNEAM